MPIFKRKKSSVTASVSASPEDGGTRSGSDRIPCKDGGTILIPKVGKPEVERAMRILQKYREGKVSLEQKIIENEQWYKMRHWECMRDRVQDVRPVSAWLFNCIANKHADAMDNFPAPDILPREQSDVGEASMLTSILPVILDGCDFEQVYSDTWMYKIKTGTGVYGVFWDPTLSGGLGDVKVCKVDLLSLFWESGITDIQKSANVFHIELEDNDALLEKYPFLEGKLSNDASQIAAYNYDDKVDTFGKSVVVDWYYKKRVGGRFVLHFCKFVGDCVLYATENDPEFALRGLYDHGNYPFVFDVMYPIEGTPTGFGYIDIGKDVQAYIDRGNQVIMKNMLANAKPRYFIRKDGAVNEEEFADTDRELIHVDGNLGRDSVIPVETTPLSEIYVSVLNAKIDELKETTGNRDISTGGTNSGVTAASAIAAMQEAGAKLSRDNNKSSYRAFKRICVMIIELIRQFYDLPRCFRIIGEDGALHFIRYTNRGIVAKYQGVRAGIDLGYRLPLFDVQVSAHRQSPYSKMSQNELALEFFRAGFFDPNRAGEALACIDMMDFDRKQFIRQKIADGLSKASSSDAKEESDGSSREPCGKPLSLSEASFMKRSRQNVASSVCPV